MIPDQPSPLRIGFKESVRSAIGIDLPVYLMLSALLIALSEAMGQPLPRTAPVSLMVGVFALIAVEILRRYVLTSRRTGGGQTAVAILRGVVWAMVVGAVPLVVFVAAGVETSCYGQECDDLSRIFLIIVLVWAVLAALMVIFGYLLLKQASWLQPRR
jgi:hypothetical protein